MRESLAAYCARLHRRDLLDQWDGSRNGTLTPDTVSYGSRQKLWWRCEQGHVWQAAVYTRAGERAAAPTAPASAPGRGLTTWPPGSLTWPRSGTPPRTGTSPRTKSSGAATAGCGGSVPTAMCGMPGSSPGRQGRAAPTAPAGRSAPGTTIWPPNTPTWPPSGTPPETGT